MNPRRRPFWPLLVIVGLVGVTMHQGNVTAQPKAGPITVPPQAPTINVAFPLGLQRGQATDLMLTGTNLNDPVALWASFPCKVTIPTDANNGKDPASLRVKLEVVADVPIGMYSIRLATKNGISNTRIFCVDELPQLNETADNKTKEKAQAVPTPCVVVGRTDAEVSDYFKVTVKPGQRLTFDVIGRRLGSLLDPVIRLYEAKSGREIPGNYSDDEPGLQSDARLTKTFKEGGEYTLEVRDSRHQGGADYYYRLRIADCPNAMTAYPVAVKRGTKAMVNFAGKAIEGVAPVEVQMPMHGMALNIAPKGPSTGWTVPVYGSDFEELVEQEPNNEPAKANRLPVPCGVTARFLEKSDLDCFVFSAKKGTKYAILAETYEINSPAEVYLVLKDAKGAEVAKSNPQTAPARIDFTPPADGDYSIVAEHLNFAHGPTEVYHLIVRTVEPDFDVALQLDRFEITPGGTTIVPISLVTRRDYAGPVDISVVDNPAFSGSVVLANTPPPPAGQATGYLTISCKTGTPAGAYDLRIQAKATVNGKDIVRSVNVADYVNQSMNGLAFPPHEMFHSVPVAVIDKPMFTLSVKMSAAEIARGVPANMTITAKRAEGFVEEIQLAPLIPPANFAIAVKPIPKGANEVTFPINTVPAVPLTPVTFLLRATTKAAGKDFAYFVPLTTIGVVLPVEVKSEPSISLKIGQKAKLKVAVTRKGDYKGPIDVELKNLPANVTASKVTVAPDKAEAEVELTAAANATVAEKMDVQVSATATGAANQIATGPNVVLKVVK